MKPVLILLWVLELAWFTALPLGAGWTAYRLTEQYFKEHLIVLPFEKTGMIVGATAFLWTLAFLLFVRVFTQKRRTTS